MVQLTNFDKLRQDPKQQIKTAAAVTVSLKNEIVEPLDEMYGHRNKRSKLDASAEQLECNMVMSSPTHDLLEEPSPLGLRLKKSPSLLDLIQMRLSEGKTVSTSSFIGSCIEKKELKSTTVVSVVDKMKASNFPASILRIGSWEYVSRYEGDLVAKCYYAKHKLVWEVLDGGLKNKIEIQWSDITALKANCIENGFETLDIMLARRPLFFRETNPQPRKHTLWQATSDFTEGQASIHRRHSLQCHQGLLNKHFEKLIQCDPRLKSLSLQPDMLLESSCFEPSCSEEQEKNEPNKCLEFDDDNHKLKENHVSSSLEIHDPKRLCVDTCVDTDPDDTSAMQMHHFHSSADENARRDNKSTRIRASMSKDYLVSHLEHCISEQMASGNRLFSSDCMPDKGMLEEWADYLLSDSHGFVSDEKSLISKVNSFNCLLQRDPSMENLQQSCRDFAENDNHKQPTGVSRKDSIGDFLSNFPRISSIPQHLQLFSIEENNDDDQDFF